jgi:hypothetical protein
MKEMFFNFYLILRTIIKKNIQNKRDVQFNFNLYNARKIK